MKMIEIFTNNGDGSRDRHLVKIPTGYEVLVDMNERIQEGDLIWNTNGFIKAPHYYVGQNIIYFCCVIRKVVTKARRFEIVYLSNMVIAVVDTDKELLLSDDYIIAKEVSEDKPLLPFQIQKMKNLCDRLNRYEDLTASQ